MPSPAAYWSAPFAQSQRTQAGDMEYPERFHIDAPQQLGAFEFGDGAHRGLTCNSQIIHKIKPIDRQTQPALPLVEKFWMAKEVQQRNGEPLIGAFFGPGS